MSSHRPKIATYQLGREESPLVVIDNAMPGAEYLVQQAIGLEFKPLIPAYPGVRAAAPRAYQDMLMGMLMHVLPACFKLDCRKLQLTMCHYSLVTTPPEQLSMIQRLPHVDAFTYEGVALVHYLFKQPYGGTAFYRHRQTGYEVVDDNRRESYFSALEAETEGPESPPPAYINGDSPLFEEIARQEGVFNRMLIYRLNSLHSGCIEREFVPDANPATGRLSINSFIAPRK